MNPGKMDRRITFQSFSVAADGYGEPVKTWANLSSVPVVWAEVTPVGGRERTQAGQWSADVDTRFRIRYRSDLDETMRVIWDSVNYNIRAIIQIGREHMLDLLCSKEKPE